jgi:RNA polymerase sigma factor for flagellar operon FliA
MPESRCKVAHTHEDELWTEYWQSGRSEAARNALIEFYLPEVRKVAEVMVAKIGAAIDVGDLVSSGVLGVIDAMTRFDAARGLKFMTFAALRIRGAMQDSLRQADIVPRLQRQHQKTYERMETQAERHLGHRPNQCEIAELAGVEEADLGQLVGDTALQFTTSIEVSFGESESGRNATLAGRLVDTREQPVNARERQREILRLVTKGLQKNERLIIILYYYEQQTMKQIGQTLGLSESRVSQMHSSIVSRLKKQLRRRKPEFAA